MFEKFTDRAKRAIALAQDEALALEHDFIGTEHILLGLIRTDGGVAQELLAEQGVTTERARGQTVALLTEAGVTPEGRLAPAKALATIGIDVAEIQRRADESFGAGRFKFPRPSFTPRAKRTLELTLREARAMKHERIETEHLLLALLDDAEGVGYQVLRDLDVTIVTLRIAILTRMAD